MSGPLLESVLLDPSELESLGYGTVIVATPDLHGRLVGRRVPVEGFARVAERGIDICTCVYAWDLEQGLDLIEQNRFALCGMHNGVPDVTLIPDLGTLRPAAWLDGVAICMADPVHVDTHEPLSLSPRVLLRRELGRLAERRITPLVGTELELYLFRNAPRDLRLSGIRDLEPTTVRPSDFMIHEGNVHEEFFQALRRSLRRSGIGIEAAQSEWGTGQWEQTFVYGEALEIADRHSLYKLAVRDSAARAGMSVTFMARPLNDQPGSSCHVHMSMVDHDRTPLFWDETAAGHTSTIMRHAIAGVLENTAGLMAWYAPTVNSYRRTNSADVAGCGRTWGFDNRTTTVRVVGHRPGDLRLEFRIPGADVNPYLALAGLLASARRGIESGEEPPAPTRGSAYDLPRDEAMPTHLAGAVDLFVKSPVAAELLTPDEIDHFRVLWQHEWDVYQSTVSDWDLTRYFDRI